MYEKNNTKEELLQQIATLTEKVELLNSIATERADLINEMIYQTSWLAITWKTIGNLIEEHGSIDKEMYDQIGEYDFTKEVYEYVDCLLNQKEDNPNE